MSNFIFKYIIVGDSSVGKSSILAQLSGRQMNNEHVVTIGVEFDSFPLIIEQHQVKLHVWDTSGQEKFHSITKCYYRNTACALLVYDITRRDTFDHIKEWMDQIKNSASDPILILIGNKSDLKSRRMIPKDEAKKFAKEHNMLFAETSAKMNANVRDVFIKSAHQIYQKLKEGKFAMDETRGVKCIKLETMPIRKSETGISKYC